MAKDLSGEISPNLVTLVAVIEEKFFKCLAIFRNFYLCKKHYNFCSKLTFKDIHLVKPLDQGSHPKVKNFLS